jgi:arylsulfatase A-like enzyme
MTGRRPDTTGIYDLHTHLRTKMPDVVTLPEHFKNHGYHTQSFGKIYHGGLDDPKSWSVPSAFSGGSQGQAKPPARRRKSASAGKPEFHFVSQNPSPRPSGPGAKPSWRIIAPDREGELIDNAVLDGAVGALRACQDRSPAQPFFLAVGFRKPHLAFWAPQRFYDLYPLDQMPLADNPFLPENSPPFATTDDSGEVRTYSDIPAKSEGPIGGEKARELIRGYFACVSYIDSLIGQLVGELDRLGLGQNTIIVLWGDHGWHLGEHAQWGKHTNFEVGTRVPLLFSFPGQSTRGTRTDRLAELVDIYPTLCELAGLPLPPGLEGDSLLPILRDPACPWESVAISQWPRPYMGYSMRTDRYRYTQWVSKTDPDAAAEGVELYDHQADPEENMNIAALPGNQDLLEELSRRLRSERRRAEAKHE